MASPPLSPSEELDLLLEQIVKLVEDRREWQAVLSKRVREGRFSLAKTRHALPNYALAPLHYPPNMKARHKVGANWTLERKGREGEARENKEEEEEDNEDEHPAPEEPLVWFTALPPASLRDAQRSFTGALEIVVKLAQNEEALRSAEQRWKELLALKTKRQ